MENKVINLKINSNFQDAEQQVKSLGTAIKVLDTEATNLDATFEEVYGDLKPLTARMGEAEDRLYELAKAGKQGSQEYKDLLKSVGEYKKVQQQTDLVVDAAAQTMSSKLSGSLNAAAGGFSLVQGSMALFGAESSSVEQAMLKVQSAMAISQGVETINQGAKSVAALSQTVQSYSIVQKVITAGQKLWNLAISANPIGVLVIAITALIAGGVALVNYFKSSSAASAANTKSVEENKRALDNQTKTLERNSTEFSKKQSQELAMAKASGMSAAAIRALELKLIDEKVAYEQSARSIAFNTYEKNKNKLASLQAAGADADIIKSQQETTNKSILEYNKQNQNVQKAFDERKAIQNRHQVEILQSHTDHLKEVQNKSNEAATKAREEAIAAQKKYDEETKAGLELLRQANLEKDFQDNINKRSLLDEQIALLEEGVDAVQASETRKNEVTAESIKKTLDQEKEAAEAKKNINNIAIQSAQGLVGILAGLGEDNKELQKAALIANGALSIAEIINNTNVGSSKEIATKGIFGLSTSTVLYAKMAISIGSVIAATAKGLSALGKSGAPSGAGGGGGGEAPAAPQFNVIGQGGANQIAQSIAGQEQQPLKAYVVSNDVTTSQSLDRNIVNNASIG